MHRLVSYVGPAITSLGGLVVLTSPAPAPVPPAAQVAGDVTQMLPPAGASGGWILFACGLGTTAITAWVNDRKDKRNNDALKDKVAALEAGKKASDDAAAEAKREAADSRRATDEAKRQADRLQERVKSLETLSLQVPNNRTMIEATAGRVDGIEEKLAAAGFLRPPPGQQPGIARPRPTVLLVEDDPAIAHMLSQLLTKKGYFVSAVVTVEEALEKVEGGPNFAVLDIMLPDSTGPVPPAEHRSGVDVLRKIREQGLPVKVVVVTALSNPALEAEIEALGPDAYLTKPIDFLELLAALRSEAGA